MFYDLLSQSSSIIISTNGERYVVTTIGICLYFLY